MKRGTNMWGDERVSPTSKPLAHPANVARSGVESSLLSDYGHTGARVGKVGRLKRHTVMGRVLDREKRRQGGGGRGALLWSRAVWDSGTSSLYIT